jgi:hypothetical protein
MVGCLLLQIQSIGGIYSLESGLTSPSFNCLLPAFTCGQYAECQQYDGKCSCPPGFGGEDCMKPGIVQKLGTCGLVADTVQFVDP